MKQSIYLQIVDDVKRKIELGVLPENEKLPSCRDLAIQLGINPNTVQRAYSALEADGYIFTIQKKGVYVSPRKKKQLVEKITREKLLELRNAGVARETLEQILEEIYKEEI